MKVVKKKTGTCCFGDLDSADVFSLASEPEYYMKLSFTIVGGEEDSCNAVEFSTGNLIRFECGDVVIRYDKAELHI